MIALAPTCLLNYGVSITNKDSKGRAEIDAQPSMLKEIEEVSHKDWVAIILAIGLSTGFNLLLASILFAITRGIADEPNGTTLNLSENATQILNGAFTGIIGVLGAYLGFKAGARQRNAHVQRTDEHGTESYTTTTGDISLGPIDAKGTGGYPGTAGG